MRNHVLLTDAAIALVVALLILVLSPGLAVTGVLALLVLLVCGVSWAIGRRRRGPRRPQPSLARRRR